MTRVRRAFLIDLQWYAVWWIVLRCIANIANANDLRVIDSIRLILRHGERVILWRAGAIYIYIYICIYGIWVRQIPPPPPASREVGHFSMTIPPFHQLIWPHGQAPEPFHHFTFSPFHHVTMSPFHQLVWQWFGPMVKGPDHGDIKW